MYAFEKEEELGHVVRAEHLHWRDRLRVDVVEVEEERRGARVAQPLRGAKRRTREHEVAQHDLLVNNLSAHARGEHRGLDRIGEWRRKGLGESRL